MPPTPPDSDSPLAPRPIHPDLLAWARQTLDVEEVLREVREIELTGGHSLESVIREIEAEAATTPGRVPS